MTDSLNSGKISTWMSPGQVATVTSPKTGVTHITVTLVNPEPSRVLHDIQVGSTCLVIAVGSAFWRQVVTSSGEVCWVNIDQLVANTGDS